MTFSVVARDSGSGEIGVAVATGWPAVGSVVPWVEPGVGAVVTQAFTNEGLGPDGLTLLRSGLAAPDVLEQLLTSDPDRDLRQVGVVDVTGGTAAHTGRGCVGEAGHACGEGVCTQGNMLERAGVWETMLAAFEAADGDLADRLMAALRAAEREGGDVRGQCSAALIVAAGGSGEPPWARRYDLRVDHAMKPVQELARALKVARAYELVPAAVDAGSTGQPDLALDRISQARELAPDEAQIRFWHAVMLSANGQADEARAMMDDTLRAEPRLAQFARRYAHSVRAGALADVLRELG